jgi:hypothetical protein
MTKTTDSRQLGMIFRGVLEKHGLWEFAEQNEKDLMVEMDLVMAAKMYFAEVKQIGAANVRQKIFETLKLSAAKASETDAMESRIQSALGINAVGKEWEDVLAFLIREDAQGRTIEKFAKACEADVYNMPKSHQIAMNPKLIISLWPKAQTPENNNVKEKGHWL